MGTQASKDGRRDKVSTCVERGLARVEGAIRLLGERKMRRQRADEDGGHDMHGRGWSRHGKMEHGVDFERPQLEHPWARMVALLGAPVITVGLMAREGLQDF